MMEKVLKPYTIIPNHLYVEREADKQVLDIISDMGRPGYVLVSRQMGKTNLLLNAKRKFENDKDVFVYIDLSNTFENVRDCFENIIDTAIDSHFDRFSDIQEKIFENRSKLLHIPPHKQHTNELRLLLKHLKGGKIVIMLDEIDALTKTKYSDEIFSQVRSSYFASRVNYEEFNNLTYLLSGVVEPNEIIKNPKISPFNIGQKIYLNDFSYDEFLCFISISKMDLHETIKDRIYYWTNGNPRMTWDLSSELENEVILGNEISVDLVDNLVTKLYLTAYDKPPIDNIRELVEADREIRNAIVALDLKKGNAISDKVKRKLYLTGIINYHEDEVVIKNRIIKYSLSLNWIKTLEEENSGLYRVAIEYFDKKEYKLCLETFKKYLSANDMKDKSTISLANYFMAECNRLLDDYEEALICLENCHIKKEKEPGFYYEVLFAKAINLHYKKQLDKCEVLYNEIIKSSRHDQNYLKSRLNYASILMTKTDLEVGESVNIFESLLEYDNLEVQDFDKALLLEVKVVSYYNLANIYLKRGRKEIGVKRLREGAKLSKGLNKACFLFNLIKNIGSVKEKRKVSFELIEELYSVNFQLGTYDIKYPLKFTVDNFKEFIGICFLNNLNELFVKLNDLTSLIGEVELGEVVIEYSIKLINNSRKEEGKLILEVLLKSFNIGDVKLSDIDHLRILRILIYIGTNESSFELLPNYLGMIKALEGDEIEYLDFAVFANIIFKLERNDNFEGALEYINVIKSKKNEVSEDLLVNYMVIHNLELNIYVTQSDEINKILTSKEILRLVDLEKSNDDHNTLLGKEAFQIIKQNALNVLNENVRGEGTRRKDKKLNRAQRRKLKRKK